MGRLVYHRKKDTGTTYVYEVVEEHWDKERKQMRNRQICIGKLDPDTGEIIPSKRMRNAKVPLPFTTATTTVIGPTLILDKIAKEIGLTSTLKRAFPEQWNRILTLAYFVVCTGDALVHADAWCRNHVVPAKGPFESQRISEWLQEITEDGRQHFFKVWGQKLIEQDYLCYDITSVSSYSKLNEYIHFGYNRDEESLPQINLALVYSQKRQLPVAYRVLPGSINDVSTLQKLLQGFKKLEFPSMTLVMDRGFYSQENITDMFNRRYHFIIGIPTYRKWVKTIIDKCQEALSSPSGYRKMDMDSLFMHTQLSKWPENGRRCYLHVYYNPHRAADDFENLIKRLLVCKEELESGERNKAHERDYQQYFLMKETPVRGLQIEFNETAIQKYRNKYAGFFTILTSRKMDAMEALRIYRDKDDGEKAFDDIKNALDMKRLRIHSSKQMDARLFVQFISLILFSQVRKTIRDRSLSSRFSPRLLLGEMESLTRIHYTRRYNDITSEVTKTQKEILEAFSLDVNTL